MPIRGSYISVSEIDRKRLLDAHKTGNDFLAVAKVLGINAGTAYSIVKTGREFKLAKGMAIAKKLTMKLLAKLLSSWKKIHFLLWNNGIHYFEHIYRKNHSSLSKLCPEFWRAIDYCKNCKGLSSRAKFIVYY